MGIFDRFRKGRRRGSGDGLSSLHGEEIRNIVEESLEATEATHDLVDRARSAHERARDLMRQGLYEESLQRFRESLTAWEDQTAVCRRDGLRNLWREMPERVAREMEEVRLTHLDILDPGSFRYLQRRARFLRRLLAEALRLGRSGEGASEKTIYDAFGPSQQDEVRNVIFQAQRRGWLKRVNSGGRYYLRTSGQAPDLSSTDISEGENGEPAGAGS